MSTATTTYALADASPAYLWPGHASRAATFENPSGVPGGGSTGRKEAANKLLAPGERVLIADFEGPGTITHLWLTVGDPMPEPAPAFLRQQLLEVFYDGGDDPSVSVPAPHLGSFRSGLSNSGGCLPPWYHVRWTGGCSPRAG